MPEISLPSLKTEIENGPLAGQLAPLAAAGDMQKIADALNEKNRQGAQPVPCHAILNYALQRGVWLSIEDAAKDPETPNPPELPLRLAARTAVKVIDSERYQVLDVAGNPAVGQMLDVLEAGGLITSDHRADIDAMAQAQISRAEELWGAGTILTSAQVADALYRTGQED